MRLSGKVVWITDTDSPAGKTLIRRLAGEGARFILNSVSGGDALRDELAYCRSVGAKTAVACVDLCRSAEVDGLLDEAAESVGSVDVLIHNNNKVVPLSVAEGREEPFLDVLHANAKSAFICTQAAGRRMAARQSGTIIFVSSIHAEKPTGSSFAYSVSRSAVKMLAREAALELGRSGVNVNTIEMGPVEGDDATFASAISTLYDDYHYKVPNAVLGTFDDLADAVLFLASDQSRYINGAELRVDGGFVLHYMNHKMKKPQKT